VGFEIFSVKKDPAEEIQHTISLIRNEETKEMNEKFAVS